MKDADEGNWVDRLTDDQLLAEIERWNRVASWLMPDEPPIEVIRDHHGPSSTGTDSPHRRHTYATGHAQPGSNTRSPTL